jgi:2',3'-cyclic-nucleotide 2'-phosphodiesterase (5'-nucleotidase family)
MSFTRRAASIGLSLIVSAAAWAAQTATLTILHTNDTHGHLLPFSYPGILPIGAQEAQLSVRHDIGGIARRATMVNRIRAELKGKPVWLIDAGDFCDGSAFSTEYHGEADTEAMNAVGYDFGTFGNHEFNNKFAEVKKLVQMCKRRLVCANAIEKADGKPLMPPFTVEKAGDLKIGLFGLVTTETATYPAAKEGVRIGSELETARKMVAKLRPKVDVLVLISHIGVEDDREIAEKVPGIDVIVGGHSHTRIPVGEFVPWDDALYADRVNGTIIVQAHQWGGELGRLDLLFSKDDAGKWHICRYRERLLPITAAVPPDPKVEAVVDKFWAPIASKYAEQIGVAAADFSERGDDLAEYSLFADAARETLGVQFEFENIGGVRAPLIKGPITLADVYTMDPFNDNLDTVTLTGKQIKDVLLREQPAASGIRYRIEFGKLVEATIGGQPIVDDQSYSGAANSYFAGYALRGYKYVDTGKGRRQTVIDYIRSKGTLSPLYDGRRVIVE